MKISRRRLILSGLAAGLPVRSWAEKVMDLGGSTLTSLSDGNLTLPEAMIFGAATLPEAEAIAEGRGGMVAALAPPCNVTLLRSGDRVILFDAGAGPDFMASAGQLPDALAAMGLDPSEVTDVIFTHGHPDHLWGVLDDFDEPFFANARHQMGRTERDYWSDAATATTIGQERVSFAAGALRRLELMGDLMEPFEDGAEVAPGVMAVMTPGHTPGHTSFVVSEGGASVMIVGDAIANAHVALARPGWAAASDQNAELGAATRTALVDQLVTDAMPFVGYHLPAGGVGQLERGPDGAVFVPLA